MLLLKIVTTVKRIKLQMLYLRKEFNDYQKNNNDSQHIDKTLSLRPDYIFLGISAPKQHKMAIELHDEFFQRVNKFECFCFQVSKGVEKEVRGLVNSVVGVKDVGMAISGVIVPFQIPVNRLSEFTEAVKRKN